MKLLKTWSFVACVLIFLSCEEDKPTNCLFFPEDLNGEINGTAWMYQGGIVEFRSDNMMSVDIFGMDEDLTGVICDISFGATDNVSFSIPSNVGDYALSLGMSGDNSQTVTMYDAETAQNIIVTDGCVQVTTIMETEVKIKFDITADADNFLRGEAILVICQ